VVGFSVGQFPPHHEIVDEFTGTSWTPGRLLSPFRGPAWFALQKEPETDLPASLIAANGMMCPFSQP